jgi:DNA primase catalytic core
MLISKADIDQIKARHELSAFVGAAGVELRKTGAYLVGKCPFHNDVKTDSLVINPKRQLWNCLGGCRGGKDAGGGKGSSGGDLFAFAMKLWGVDFRAAFVRLGGEVKAELPPPRRRGAAAGLGAPVSRAPRAEVMAGVVEHWERELASHAEAQAYLEGRGLQTKALWRAFRLGYSSGSLVETAGAPGSAVGPHLLSLGILTPQGKERMAGRVVFPLLALNQLPVSAYGRAIDPATEPRHQYLPGPLRGLFNWNAARRAEEIILVESVIDALSLVEAGVGQAIALFGAHGVTEEHKELVRRFGVRRVVVALDADETGRKAALDVAASFAELAAEVDVIEWPEEDPNALLVRRGPAQLRALTERLLCKAPAPAWPPAEASADVAGEPAVSGAAFPLTAASLLLGASTTAIREEAAMATPALELPAPISPAPRVTRTQLLGDVLAYVAENRQWRVTWLAGTSPAHLRATLRLSLGAWSFLDAVDLVAAKGRESYAKRSARSLAALAGPAGEAVQRELAGKVEADLLALAELGEERRRLLEQGGGVVLAMSTPERAEALALLRSPDLLAAVAAAFDAVGYVGEGSNKVLGYLVGISRKLERTMSMVILSPSGSGKSGLAEGIEALTPEEDFVSLSSLSSQALYYLPPGKLRHKLVLIEERAGSTEADFSIRALQSKQKLSRAVPIKDPATGKIETKIFEILGPAAFLETTTESGIHPENATRCFEVHLDESEAQTRRIQAAQRRSKTLAGVLERPRREAVVRLHHNAQRLLRPVVVVVPFAEEIEFPSAWLRTRRDNLRFLNLIEAIAFLHQHQRPLVRRGDQEQDQEPGADVLVPVAGRLADLAEEELAEVLVEATLEDYALACELAGGLLGETLQDLKKPERAFLDRLRTWVAEEGRGEEGFSRREVREALGLPQRRVRELFEALLELEYAEPVGSSRGAGARYRLVASPETAVMPGLLTPEELARKLQAIASAAALEPAGAGAVTEWAEWAKRDADSTEPMKPGVSANGRMGGGNMKAKNHRHRRTVTVTASAELVGSHA